jgi:prolyl oligopeptidase
LLFTATENDPRVDPMHSRKMAAAMQWANASERPVLLKLSKTGGHGHGNPLTKTVDDLTDVLAFLFAELGLN